MLRRLWERSNPNEAKMLFGGFAAGVATTIIVSRGIASIKDRRRNFTPSTEGGGDKGVFDHMVIRTRDAEHLEKSISFWKDNFEYEIDREEEAAAWLKDPDNNRSAFPSVRINESCVIDLFPVEMKKFYCKATPETNYVDHFCLNLSGSKVLNVLDKFEQNKVSLLRVVGEFDGEVFNGPWGAKGRGVSIYLHDPNGLYTEIRTYDLEYVPQIREKALKLIKE